MNIKNLRRRVEIEIKVGGDTWDDALSLLREYANEAVEGGRESVTGGPSAGGYYKASEDKSITHESYFEQIKSRKDRNDP